MKELVKGFLLFVYLIALMVYALCALVIIKAHEVYHYIRNLIKLLKLHNNAYRSKN